MAWNRVQLTEDERRIVNEERVWALGLDRVRSINTR